MINIEQKFDHLNISYINEDGGISFQKLPVKKEDKFVWRYLEPGEKRAHPLFKSWDKKPIKRVKARFLDKFGIEEFLMKQSPHVIQKINQFNMPKMHFCDIEVISGDGLFPDPNVVRWPVNTIAIANSDFSVFVMGDKPLNKYELETIQKEMDEHIKPLGKSFELKYIYYENEWNMLYDFFNKVMPKITLITGWNFIDFDWTYLFNRANKLKVPIAGASPSGNFVGRYRNMPEHKLVVDYLEIYKKWDRVVSIKENDTLDYVSEAALKVKKISYTGNLKQLYENNFSKFVLYNVIDSVLIYFLDKKLNTMQTFLTIGCLSQVEHQKAFSPVAITESVYFKRLYKRRLVLLRPLVEPENANYEGAYVKKPVVGLHEWTVGYDFASLYPTTERQFNISPESFLGMIDELDKNNLKTVKHIVTSSGAVFENERPSAMKESLDDLYGARKISKKKAAECEMEIDRLKKLAATM